MLRRHTTLLALAATIAASACSSGSTSGGRPAVAPTVPGVGFTGALSATVAFAVAIPAGKAATNGRRHIAAATAAPDIAPYISPQVGFISITDVAVNGDGLAVAAPSTVLSTACAAAGTGCAVTVRAAAAPNALNRFLVQTFAPSPSGSTSPGPVISTGFVDVAVASSGTATQSIGGVTQLSVGGYVASLKISVASTSVVEGTPKDSSLLVEAIDAAGAIIIGNTLFANPITLKSSDSANFTFPKLPNGVITGTSTAQVQVHYSGGQSPGTIFEASTTDENGNVVDVKLPFLITPAPPKPTATPVATPIPRLSIYALDIANDYIVEYSGLDAVLAHNGTLSSTPRRVIQFSGPLAGDTATCNGTAINNIGLPDTGGLILDDSGNIILQTSCGHGITDRENFKLAASSVGATPDKTVFDDPSVNQFGPYALGIERWKDELYFQWNSGLPEIVSTSLSSGAVTSDSFSGCLPELGYPADCSAVYAGFGGAFGADDSFVYLGNSYQDQPLSGSLTTYSLPGVISVYPLVSGNNPSPTPQLDIGGPMTQLASQQGSPYSFFRDGDLLYVLTNSPATLSAPNVPLSYDGLSSCPAPSANAPLDGLTITCADGNTHDYLMAFNLRQLSSIALSSAGKIVDMSPLFVIGGDSVGHFGCKGFATNEMLAESNGIVVVANIGCGNAIGSSVGNLPVFNFPPPFGGELDIYDTRGVVGSHTDIAPVVIPNISANPATGFQGTYYGAVAIGPTGSTVGGLSLLKRRNPHINYAGRRIHLVMPHPPLGPPR